MFETGLRVSRPPQVIPGIEAVIAALGTPGFGAELITLLHRECAAEHCAALQFQQRVPKRIVSVSADGTDSAQKSIDIYLNRGFAERDRTVKEARRLSEDGVSVLLKVSTEHISDAHFRDVMYRRTGICERVLIFETSDAGEVGISVLRSDKTGPFSDRSFDRLSEMSSMLLAMVKKHAEVSAVATKAWPVLTSLADIEARLIRTQTALSRREAQVCARILHGVHVSGIAIDLGIGDESVLTYRKRAFRRLGLGSRHELMVWYLALCRRSAP